MVAPPGLFDVLVLKGPVSLVSSGGRGRLAGADCRWRKGDLVDAERPAGRVVDQNAVVDAVEAQMQALELPDWPVFGWAVSDQQGWLCGCGVDGARGVESVRLDYRAPGGTQHLVVQTEPDSGQAPDLAHVARQLSDDDEGEPFGLGNMVASAGVSQCSVAVPALVDGEQIATVEQRIDGETVISLLRVRGALIVVAAGGVTLERLVLAQVTDLTPFKQRRVVVVQQFLAGIRSGGASSS